MIEAAARAAWETEKGLPIAAGIIESLRSAGIILPPPQTIERAGLAGRARARTRAAEALLQGTSEENLASLDALLVVDAKTGRAPLSSMKDVPSAPKADHVPVRADKPPEADALADRLGALMPRIRITELLDEVARETGFLSAFTNFRTHQTCENENALLAAVLADATNLGLSRMADASHGVTRDQLIWTRDA